jgi:excisionase family DNA binding protein
MQDTLTRKELAKALRVSLRTVDRYHLERGMPFQRVGPGLIRFDLAAVRRWQADLDQPPPRKETAAERRAREERHRAATRQIELRRRGIL